MLIPRSPNSTLFPYTTLFRSYDVLFLDYQLRMDTGLDVLREVRRRGLDLPVVLLTGHGDEEVVAEAMRSGDRKSTRLNSSHVEISYAVFCLKKKIWT